MPREPPAGECAIEFISDQKSFDIVADTEQMADEWSSDIADAISACSAGLLLMETQKVDRAAGGHHRRRPASG